MEFPPPTTLVKPASSYQTKSPAPVAVKVAVPSERQTSVTVMVGSAGLDATEIVTSPEVATVQRPDAKGGVTLTKV